MSFGVRTSLTDYTESFIFHSLDFLGVFFGVDGLLFDPAGFFFTEPFGRPRGRFGPVGLGADSFFFVDFEPLGRPLPLLTTGSPDSLLAAAAGSLGGRPRFFAELAASTSGILIKCSFYKL